MKHIGYGLMIVGGLLAIPFVLIWLAGFFIANQEDL